MNSLDAQVAKSVVRSAYPQAQWNHPSALPPTPPPDALHAGALPYQKMELGSILNTKHAKAAQVAGSYPPFAMQHQISHDMQQQHHQAQGQYAQPSYMNGRIKSETGSDRSGSPHTSDPRYPPPQSMHQSYPSMPYSHPNDMRYPSPSAGQLGVPMMTTNGYGHGGQQHPQEAYVPPQPPGVMDQPPTSVSTPQKESTGPPKAFACSTCGKGFARRSDLARHERIHSGIRPHVCDWQGCGKQFIQRSALTVHQRVHTGEKPHMCERCGKPFSDSSSLARHRRIHSGKRPYKCPYADCQKTFTRRTTLTRHQNHHTGTVEEAAAATAAALASRASVVSRSTRSEADEYSEHNSPMPTPSPNDRPVSLSPSVGMGGIPSMHRNVSDMGYPSIPNHLRNDLQPSPRSSPALNQQPYMGQTSHGRPSMTSHPNGYGPPQILEPPTSHGGQSTSAHGSPHMGAMPSWQSPSHQGMGSPAPNNGSYYPDPQYGAHQQASMYYGDVRQRGSTEPDQYDPRQQQQQMWAAPVQ